MKQEIKTEFYASPEVEVLWANAQHVMCASQAGQLGSMINNEEVW